jgi:hypothetical protein
MFILHLHFVQQKQDFCKTCTLSWMKNSTLFWLILLKKHKETNINKYLHALKAQYAIETNENLIVLLNEGKHLFFIFVIVDLENLRCKSYGEKEVNEKINCHKGNKMYTNWYFDFYTESL